MNIVTGIDIVDIREFQNQMKNGGDSFMKRCFSSAESDNKSVNSLAGVFAGKEAVIKALSLGAGTWRDIVIGEDSSGRPTVEVFNFSKMITSCDLSIAHDSVYAIAQFVAILS